MSSRYSSWKSNKMYTSRMKKEKNKSRMLLLGVSRELLVLNRPRRPEEDVKDSVLPKSHWQAWKKWESTKR